MDINITDIKESKNRILDTDLTLKPENEDFLLTVKNLQVSFKMSKNNYLTIVRGIDLFIKKAEIVGSKGSCWI